MKRTVQQPRRTARAGRGQAMVEFALVAPVFFLLLFGIIEGGRFILYYQTLNNAAREGARYAIVHGSNSFCPSGPMPPGETAPACYDRYGAKVLQQVQDTAFGLLGSDVTATACWDPQVQPDGTCTDGGLGNGRDVDVDVVASYTYRPIIPIVPLPPITIRAESTL